jgi:protein-S-isoprenylcysteine O-methyltransferase Ste14
MQVGEPAIGGPVDGLVPIVIIGAGTASLVALSWRSFPHPRSHGFFRFFAFEAILWLVVLDAPHWFSHPGAPRQLVSWTLLAGSFVLALHGFHLLRLLGRPTTPAAGSPTYRFENTTALVMVGAYKYIRHPLYASALLAAWGTVLKSVSPLSIALGVVATSLLAATARAEERENLVRFGDAYREYMDHTRLLIPFLW